MLRTGFGRIFSDMGLKVFKSSILSFVLLSVNKTMNLWLCYGGAFFSSAAAAGPSAPEVAAPPRRIS